MIGTIRSRSYLKMVPRPGEQAPQPRKSPNLPQPMRCVGAYKCVRSERAPRLDGRLQTRARTRLTLRFKEREHELSMNNAELYHRSNLQQKRDALQCLQEYEKKMRWKNYERVVDIGCGDGGVTTQVLRQFIPANFEKLVGCDLSARMVEFANRHHSDERTTFSVLDIEGELPTAFVKSFDHAFSFYTLHWIANQEHAFGNIYELLADGGECLLIFLGHMPIFNVFRALARRPKWKTWLMDVDRFVSPYHDSQNPEKDIRIIMTKAGFKKIEVQAKEMSFVYGLEECRKAVSAVNPFDMPPEVEDEFLKDYLLRVKEMQMMFIDQENNNLDDVVPRPEEQAPQPRKSPNLPQPMRCVGAYKCVRSERAPRLGGRLQTRARTRLTLRFKEREHELSMNNAELYHRSNPQQKRDALQCLQEYEKKMQWKNYERVVDIGCGDGGVTTQVLRQFIPANFEKLVGCDLSATMVEFANRHHSDERTTFSVLDIEGKLPPAFVKSFDHAFSFYALHWIANQEHAFGNIYELLADGGECLLIFLGHTIIYNVYRTLARRPKWKTWLMDVDRFVSPYYDSQDLKKT